MDSARIGLAPQDCQPRVLPLNHEPVLYKYFHGMSSKRSQHEP